MSVIDYIKPVEYHNMGISRVVLSVLKNMNPATPQFFIDKTLRVYYMMLRRIERELEGRGDYNNEEDAAKAVSHMIIDAAFVHDRLCAAGQTLEAFPYNHLAGKILPKREEVAEWNLP